MDTEHSYYARVLDEVERLQPVGAGGGILVLNLMYPCFEPGARVGMDLSVRSGEDAFPVGTWKVGRPYTRTGISTVRCARPAARSPVAVFLWWPLSTGSMESLD